MVLSYEKIVDFINSEDIKVIKSVWQNQEIKEYLLVPSELKNSHKIRLHMGYLIRTLSDKRWLNPEYLFRKKDGIIDLRKIPENIYVLYPGEAIMLYTNEYVELKKGCFGLILSRVSNEDNGMVVTPSYIDPNWKGVLQLIMTNHSEKEIEIKMGCAIANLFIWRMDGDTEPPLSNMNDHYDVSWKLIFEDTKFPKWKSRERNIWLRLSHHIRTHWKGWIAVAVTVIVSISTILYNIVNTFFK